MYQRFVCLQKRHLNNMYDTKMCYVATLQRQNLGLVLHNALNAELNPICYLLALLGAHHFLHVSRIRVNIVILVTVLMNQCR